ncbi:hypothetical protein EHM92_00325 [bacterium]|nr:MAG: hypothetical protein EHM92_00325 [bacterium]
MKFAHSLGYPHSDMMLSDMTASQYHELMVFFQVEEDEREELKSEAEQRNLASFFQRKIAQQKKEKSNG